MKFNFVADVFLGSDKNFDFKTNFIGGSQIYLYDLSKHLIENGHQVYIIQKGLKNKELEFDGINIKKIKSSLPLRLIWRKYIDRDADRIHLHDFEHAFPLASKKVTATCHGITWDLPKSLPYKNSLYWKFHNTYHKFFADRAIKKLDKIASVDSFLLKYVQSKYPDMRDKLNVIYSYVNMNFFNPNINGNKIKKEYNNKPIILFPRNLTYVRGCMLILKAFKKILDFIPEATLIMVGDGPQRKEVENFINKNNLNKNVFLIGHKDHFKEMPYYYAAADVVTIPSLGREGASLSCLESMAVKTPVVATNIGGLNDLILDNFNGLLSKVDSDDLASKIIYLLNNKRDSNYMIKNALQIVKKRHTYENWRRKYSKFFGVN